MIRRFQAGSNGQGRELGLCKGPGISSSKEGRFKILDFKIQILRIGQFAYYVLTIFYCTYAFHFQETALAIPSDHIHTHHKFDFVQQAF